MLIKKILVSVLLAAGMVAAVATPLPALAYVNVQLNFAPPPPRDERVPEMRRGYVWSPGYWDYRHGKHVWVRGVAIRERHGYEYQPNRWVENNGHWNLQRGSWARRDNDGDGVPNGRDSQPNNPNRR